MTRLALVVVLALTATRAPDVPSPTPSPTSSPTVQPTRLALLLESYLSAARSLLKMIPCPRVEGPFRHDPRCPALHDQIRVLLIQAEAVAREREQLVQPRPGLRTRENRGQTESLPA
jgi:hypothetical protein